MLRFKQFISSYLTEATIKHFAHLGLDPDNQEHNDLVNAYNLGHSKNDPNVPRNPNQIKSLEHLTAVAAPHYKEIQLKRKEEARHQKAIKSGHAELVHHDPKTGVKVFRVKNAKGCAAVGSSKWCVSQQREGQEHFDRYDPASEHSYVIHTPEKGNFSKIGMIGIKPNEDVDKEDQNFQDKGNNWITDDDWENLIKKYKLDSVKALHGIRGLTNKESKKDTQNRKNEFLRKIEQKTLKPQDIDHALKHGYLSANHILHPKFDVYSNTLDKILNADKYRYTDKFKEIAPAIIKHKNVSSSNLSNIALSAHILDGKAINNLATHERSDDFVLSNLINSLSVDHPIHDIVINNQNIGKRTLASLANKSNNQEIHRKIANHDKLDPYAIYSLASKYNVPEDKNSILNAIENNTQK